MAIRFIMSQQQLSSYAWGMFSLHLAIMFFKYTLGADIFRGWPHSRSKNWWKDFWKPIWQLSTYL